MPAPAPSPDLLGQLQGRGPAYDDPPLWPAFDANRNLIAQVLLRNRREQERNRV